MQHRKSIHLVAGAALVLAMAVGTFYFSKKKPQAPGPAAKTIASQAPAQSAPASSSQPQNVAELPADFLGTLTPGGNAESAGVERTYIVSYQVAFLRTAPAEKLPEESLTYQELSQREARAETIHPHFYYGEDVLGKYDPAHPESIAVRATMNGKEAKGYIDARKLWLEPPLDHVESNRYMSLKDTTSVYVVPDPAGPPVLSILQGEVAEAVGQLNFQGRQWIKARFNATVVPRYGFLLGSDVRALTFSTVNQSAVALEEVPARIRYGNLAFSTADRQQLSQNGFYIEAVPPLEPVLVDDMADSYRERVNGPQFFITSDLFLHSFHLIFDRMLQDIEEKKTFPVVKKMASNLARTTENELKALPPNASGLHDALLHDLFYFSVAARLFDPSFAISDAVRSQTEAFVSKVQSPDGELPSQANFLGFDGEDFTQYKVRGHYEKNETLQRYFRGMMWFGRHNFLLSDKTQTLAAILVPGLVDRAQETGAFGKLDALILYLIGGQDKYTLTGYRSINRKIFGTETPGLRQLANNLDENLAVFQRTAPNELPSPQIVSVQTGIGKTQEERLSLTRGFKFLGQRYTLDALVLNQLTSPSVGTDANRRNLPSALDVMMLLGSKAATDVQQKIQKEHQWSNYENQITKLKGITNEQVTKRATFYQQWLYAVKTLFLPTASKQLSYLAEPWQFKSLNTGLASWTELKHDTILYAEQSTAEMGEGEGFPAYAPPEPKGYIEPNPVFFKQLSLSIDQMLGQLKGSDFITEEYLDKFTLFRELAHKAEAIAQKEVSGELVTREDYRWIENVGDSFDSTLLLPRDANVIADPSYLQMALIADVASDAVEGRVLEDGTGAPQRIIVLVKDASGGTRLTVGYVYSWFEFAAMKRWNDFEWKKIIYSSNENERKQQGIKPPVWYSKFLKSANGAS